MENRVAQSEAVHESIKNAILVMHTAGMFAPLADDPRNEGELWQVTRDKIEQFMPGFMESVVPLSVPLSSAAALPSSAEVSTTALPTAENQDPSLAPVDTVKPRTSTEPVGGTSIV